MDFSVNANFVEPPLDFPPFPTEPPSNDLLVPNEPGGTDQGGGWGDFDYYNDWGSTGSSWDSASDPDIQKVVIVGQRMTVWEKWEYDHGLDGFSNYLGATMDSAFATARERGYITVGGSAGIGVVVTMDASNHDIYIGITTGFGPIVAAGLTPDGMTQSDFLSGWSGSAVTGTGVGIVEASGTYAPVFGTPGMSIAYSINATQEVTNGFYTVTTEAHQYINKVVFPDKYY